MNKSHTTPSHGWEYGTDKRHADILINELGTQGANNVANPNEEDRHYEMGENLVELAQQDSSRHKQLTVDGPNQLLAAR